MHWQLSDEASNVSPLEVIDGILSFGSLWTKGRRVFVTQRGFGGLRPAEAESGDVACILSGGELPNVVRPLDQGEFAFLGPSYVHGIMKETLITKSIELNMRHLF